MCGVILKLEHEKDFGCIVMYMALCVTRHRLQSVFSIHLLDRGGEIQIDRLYTFATLWWAAVVQAWSPVLCLQSSFQVQLIGWAFQLLSTWFPLQASFRSKCHGHSYRGNITSNYLIFPVASFKSLCRHLELVGSEREKHPFWLCILTPPDLA